MSHGSRCSGNQPFSGLLTGLLIGLLAASLGACKGVSDPVPAELLQIWTTDAPAYKGRYFELRDGTLLFGTGPHTFAMHGVEHVEATATAPGSVEYVFDYRSDEGETAQVRFVHTAGPPATIRMANHDEVWTPQSQAKGEDRDG